MQAPSNARQGAPVGSRRIDLQIDRLVLARRVRSVGGGPVEGAPRRRRGDARAAAARRHRTARHTGPRRRARPAAVRPLRPRRALVARPDGAHHGAAGRADGVQPARPLRDLERQGRRRAPDAGPVPRCCAGTRSATSRRLAHAMARDHAMQWWLDMLGSHKSDPNENFARELMELFTLGVGHYTERDVREAARAFTGFDYDWDRRKYRWDPDRHDDGVKTVFGHRGRFGPGRDGRSLPAPSGARAVPGAQAVELLHRHAAVGRDDAAAGAGLPALRVRAEAGAADDPRLARAFYANLEEPDLVKPPVVYAAGMLRGDPPARRHRRLDVAAVEHGPAAVLPAERGRLADERGVADDAVGQGARGCRGAPAVRRRASSSTTGPSSATRSRRRPTLGRQGRQPPVDVGAHARQPAGDRGAASRPAGDWDNHAAAERRRVLRLLLLAGPDAQVC